MSKVELGCDNTYTANNYSKTQQKYFPTSALDSEIGYSFPILNLILDSSKERKIKSFKLEEKVQEKDLDNYFI